jgi:hypothetical protein
MLRPLDRGVAVVVAQVPSLIRAYDVTTSRADDLLATLDALSKLTPAAAVLRAVRLALATVACNHLAASR